MPNIRISDAADAGTLLASDMLPLARSGNTNAYHATMAEVAAFASTSLASGAYGNVGRNLLHNPLFNVAQRGAGPFTVSGINFDRWYTGITTDTVGVTSFGLLDADRAAIGDEAAITAMQTAVTGNAAAGALSYLQQSIESVRRLSGKTVTVSFWAMATAGTPRLGFNTRIYYGSGGSPSATINGLTTGLSVTLSTTWTRYSLITALPSAAGKTLGTNGDDSTAVQFYYSSGATNNAVAGNIGVQTATFRMWGVQLEIGSVATPLEKPDPRYDLSNCQRFCSIAPINIRVNATAAQAMSGPVYLPAAMRATPTANPYVVGSRSNVAAPSVTMTDPSGGRVNTTSNAAGDAYVLDEQWIFSADL